MVVLGVLYFLHSFHYIIRSISWGIYLREKYPNLSTPILILDDPKEAWSNAFKPTRLLVFPTKEMKVDPEYIRLTQDPRFIKQRKLLIANYCMLIVFAIVFMVLILVLFSISH